MTLTANSADLYTAYSLGPLRLPNRFVMAPMTRNRAGTGNVPTAVVARYYEQRASAGLLVTEATQVAPEGVGYPNTPGIHSIEQVAGWRRVTDAIHRAGGRIFLQLWHVGRISHRLFQPGGGLPVAPSAVAPAGQVYTVEGMMPFETPRALTSDEIPGIVEQFRIGAANALAAGFDGVEIHAANGYLPDQFLRDGTNRRTDAYGGSVQNRARFLLDIVRSVIGVWGPDRVGVRLSPGGTFNDMTDSDPLKTFGYVIGELDQLGIRVCSPGRGERRRHSPGRLDGSYGSPAPVVPTDADREWWIRSRACRCRHQKRRCRSGLIRQSVLWLTRTCRNG